MFETVFPNIKKYFYVKSFSVSDNLDLDYIFSAYIEISVKYKLNYFPITKRYRVKDIYLQKIKDLIVIISMDF